MTRTRARLAAACLGLALAAIGSAPAHAADEINIDHVETADDGTVSLLLAVDGLPTGATLDPADVTVRVNGEEVDAKAETTQGDTIERTTVVVFDSSNSMQGEKLSSATSAIDAFLQSAPPDVNIGLVSFAGEVKQTVEPSTDHGAITTELAATTLTPGTKMYDAVAEGVELAGAEGARSVFLLSDGADTGSTIGIDELGTLASEAGVIVDAVALGRSPAQQAALQGLASQTGGRVIEADTQALGEVFAAQADALASQLLVSFTPPEGTTGDVSFDVEVVADGVPYADSAFVAMTSPDPITATPDVVEPSEPLIGRTGLLVGLLAFGLGIAGVLAFALGGVRTTSLSDRRLESYFGAQAEPTGGGRRQKRKAQSSLKDSAVDLTSTFVKGDFEDRLALRLAGAGSSLKPAEWLLLHVAIAIGAAFAGLVARGGALMVIMGIIGAVGPWFWLKRKHSKRQAAFNAQLAETLTLMAGGLSAGLSLPQSIDTVVREGHEPMAGELRRALVEQRLGIPVEEALENVGDRMGSEDFSWVVMAIRIQREVGGNLAELLNTVSETLREREYLRRQVRVLSAEGRFSGYVLTALPIALFCYMIVFKRDFVEPMFTTGMGYVLLAIAVVMLLAGSFVMSRLTKIKV